MSGSVVYKLVTQAITTLSTSNLVGAPSLLLFGDAVLVDGLSKGRPGGGVLVFRLAGEKFVATFCTYVQTGFKVIFKDLSSGERAEGHGRGPAVDPLWTRRS